jgi:hypothetical protein
MKIGIIGESTGNGHPYSWSAIINGFDINILDKVPFPAIQNYLYNVIPTNVLNNKVKVTKIFCKNIEYARHVAMFARIDQVSPTLQNFADDIDAIIIAKDDYKNHYTLIKTLAPYKLPILIDKPIATNLTDLNKILSLKTYKSQFFSCSGLYFSPEIKDFPNISEKIIKIKVITHGPWDRYSIHMINPLQKYFSENGINFHKFTSFKKSLINTELHLELRFNDLIVELVSGSTEVFGVEFIFENEKNETFKIELTNTYTAFSDMLSCFIQQIKNKKSFFSIENLENTVKLIELGE